MSRSANPVNPVLYKIEVIVINRHVASGGSQRGLNPLQNFNIPI